MTSLRNMTFSETTRFYNIFKRSVKLLKSIGIHNSQLSSMVICMIVLIFCSTCESRFFTDSNIQLLKSENER